MYMWYIIFQINNPFVHTYIHTCSKGAPPGGDVLVEYQTVVK